MKDGEPNKRDSIENAIRRRASLVQKSIDFWEARMEKAFDKLEKFDYLENDPFSSEALEITEEDENELNEIYHQINFLNKKLKEELINTAKVEREIEDFIKEFGD